MKLVDWVDFIGLRGIWDVVGGFEGRQLVDLLLDVEERRDFYFVGFLLFDIAGSGFAHLLE